MRDAKELGARSETMNRTARVLLIVLLVLLLLGALPTWGYSAGWGYYPAGGLGTVLVIVLILLLVGAI
jgi:sterol desaturase/sphingolipid hydroxylase (fatty acid hydroxylase superfamily)